MLNFSATKKYLHLFIICFLILSPQLIFSQDKKPKVALVLSGGGAKGLAHIPTLQLLDSLGIVPDLIIGTSMGSIVGGLYAMGYSGDSIAIIVNNAKWDELFGGKTSLQQVSVEEKSEYGQYLIDFDLVNGKPKMKSALLNDQNLREFISILTYPTYKINDFDSLSIPFRAVATDIVNGKEVIMGKGSLSLAMRASMSIPSIFLPVPYNNTLLVDGGILNNFPVDIAKNMGADIIIGSDVGGGMIPKEKLNSISNLLFQASMLTSSLKNVPNRKLTDILIDHVPNLTYSTKDFNKSQELMEEGKIATRLNRNKLVALAEKLKEFKQKSHQLPYAPKTFAVDTILFKNISEANLDLVRSKLNIQTHKKYTPEELIDGVNRVMGTNIFSQITYSPVIEGGKSGFQVNGFEKAQHQIKGSIHFDSYRGFGLFLNYTGRNIIGKASRFLVSIDIAEQPGFRVQYQKNFGDQKDWWWRSEVLGQKLTQNFYFNGEKIDNFNFSYFQIDNQFNRNINSLNSYAGIGFNYEKTDLRPELNTDIVDNVFFLNDYNFKNFEIYGQYRYNTMNFVFFPTKGTLLNAKLSRSFYHEVDIVFTDEINPNVKGSTNGFTKLGLNFEKRLSLNKKITGIIGATSGFIFADKLESDEISFLEFGFGGSYFLGGILLRPRKDVFSFPGLNEGEIFATQFMMLNLGVQYSPIKSLYLIPHFNIASVGFGNFDDYIKDAFSPKGNWRDISETSSLISAGITTSYNSLLGPVNFDISWVNSINKVRLFIGVGIQFNRSN